jgi:hypothetical protein
MSTLRHMVPILSILWMRRHRLTLNIRVLTTLVMSGQDQRATATEMKTFTLLLLAHYAARRPLRKGPCLGLTYGGNNVKQATTL